MPHKFNADRRDKIAKQKYQMTNWPAYNESLRQRGDLTIWVKDEALSLWTARRRTSRGGQPKYSDLAITLCLTLRVVYGLALRQTKGLMRSVVALMGFDIAVPDFSTMSRRSKGLALPSTKSRATTSGPVHLVVDSTGLKVFGEGVRGSLAKQLIARYKLDASRGVPKFGIGLKELREVKPEIISRPRAAFLRLAARNEDRWRLLPLSPGGQSGCRRFRRPPQLQEPVSLSVRGIPAL
ncbi:hypothetical protein JOH52_007203 [Sinorhizobium meliloti]|nr:hypothetical protein [Sinorhizobium meliloti]